MIDIFESSEVTRTRESNDMLGISVLTSYVRKQMLDLHKGFSFNLGSMH